MTHRWRLGTTNLASINGPDIGYVYFPLTNGYIIGNQTNSFLVLTNVSLSTTGRYSISTSNVAGQALSAVASLTLVADTDGDGLPDSWESGRAGFSPNNPADAARDDDGDGMSNLAEYIAGTDYLDPTSYLKVEIVAAGQASLRFNAVSIESTPCNTVTDSIRPCGAPWQIFRPTPIRDPKSWWMRTQSRTVSIAW